MADQSQRDVAELIRDLKDPRVGMVTINSVDVTPDYAHAQIYFSVLIAKPEDSAAALNEAAGFLRNGLFKRLFRFGPIVLLQLASESRTGRSAKDAAKDCTQGPASAPGDAIAQKPSNRAARHCSNGLLVAVCRAPEDSADAGDFPSAAAVTCLHYWRGACRGWRRVDCVCGAARHEQRNGCRRNQDILHDPSPSSKNCPDARNHALNPLLTANRLSLTLLLSQDRT